MTDCAFAVFQIMQKSVSSRNTLTLHRVTTIWSIFSSENAMRCRELVFDFCEKRFCIRALMKQTLIYSRKNGTKGTILPILNVREFQEQ